MPLWPTWPIPAVWVKRLSLVMEMFAVEMGGRLIASGLHIEPAATHHRGIAPRRVEEVSIGQWTHRAGPGEESPFLSGQHAPQLRIRARRRFDGKCLIEIARRRGRADLGSRRWCRRTDGGARMAGIHPRALLRLGRADHARERTDSVEVHR